jgi:hypothetical protein
MELFTTRVQEPDAMLAMLATSLELFKPKALELVGKLHEDHRIKTKLVSLAEAVPDSK